MNYGEKVRHIRKLKGMKAKTLANHLQVSQATISQIEKGLYELTPDKTLAMANFFDVPVNYFLNENYQSLDEFDLDVKKTNLLNNNKLVNYIVLADKATQNDVSLEELEQAIDFIIELKKKRTGSN